MRITVVLTPSVIERHVSIRTPVPLGSRFERDLVSCRDAGLPSLCMVYVSVFRSAWYGRMPLPDIGVLEW